MGGWAAAGQILGSLIGAGGQFAAGQAGQASNSSADQVAIGFDPNNIPTFAGSQNDALSLIGRQNFLNEPTPIGELINRINSLPVNNKVKRRALRAIQIIREQGNDRISDPAFSRKSAKFDPDSLNRIETQDVPRGKELRDVLKRLGLTDGEFEEILASNQAVVDRNRRIQEQLAPIQENTILQRARTAAAANRLLGDAAGFAQTGEPQSQAQEDILNRVNRGIDDQEEAFLLRSNFGGFQPGAGVEAFQRARTDAPLTAFEQALAQAAGLTAGLGGGLEFVQQGAGQAVGAGQGAAGIAAQQAAAANQIRASIGINNATSLANGIGAGSAALGSGIANAGLIGSWAPGATNGYQQSNIGDAINPTNAEFNRIVAGYGGQT